MISQTELRHVVYAYNCNKSTLQVKGKLNSITLGEKPRSECWNDEMSRSFSVSHTIALEPPCWSLISYTNQINIYEMNTMSVFVTVVTYESYENDAHFKASCTATAHH